MFLLRAIAITDEGREELATMGSKNTDNLTDATDQDLVATAVRLAGRREVPPATDRERIFDVAAATLQRKLAGKRRRQRTLLAIAASLLLAVAISISLPLTRLNHGTVNAEVDRVIGTPTLQTELAAAPRPVKEGLLLSQHSLIRTGESGQLGILLVNGVSVRLFTHTTIQLLADNRLELQEGTVYVDAGTNPATSIEVVSDVGVARDIGTQFEIRYINSDYRLRIREGEVSLATSDRSLLAEAGEELTLDSVGSAQVKPFTSNEQDWAWAENLAPVPNLDGKPLVMLLDWVSRETGRAIEYATKETEYQAASTLLHGSVSKMNPLDTLSAMLSTTNLRYLLQEDGTILVYPEG